MEQYLALIEQVVIENGLCGSILIGAAGLVVVSLLLSVLSSIRSERRLKQLTQTLANERSQHEQACIQLTDSVNRAHEKIQEQEEASNLKTQQLEKAAVIEQQLQQSNAQQREILIKLEQILSPDIETNTNLSEDELIARQQQLVDNLIKRLETEEQRCAELNLFLQTGQTMLAEKDSELDALHSAYEEQSQQLIALEQDFAARQAKLNAKYQAYRHYFGRMAWSRMQLCNELNQANQARAQLEMALKNQPLPIITAPEPVVIVTDELPSPLPEPEIIQAVVEEPVAMPVNPVESTELPLIEATPEIIPEVTPETAPSKPTNALFAKLMNAVKSDFGLKKTTDNIEADDRAEAETDTQAPSPAPVIEPEMDIPASETPPTESTTSANPFARIKNVFATKKPAQNPQENETINPPEPEPMSAPVETVVLSSDNTANTLAKVSTGLKNQWSGLFKKTIAEEPEEVAPIEEPSPPSTEATQNTSNMGNALKGLYQKISSRTKS